MTVTLKGHDYKYAVEQMLLTLFPVSYTHLVDPAGRAGIRGHFGRGLLKGAGAFLVPAAAAAGQLLIQADGLGGGLLKWLLNGLFRRFRLLLLQQLLDGLLDHCLLYTSQAGPEGRSGAARPDRGRREEAVQPPPFPSPVSYTHLPKPYEQMQYPGQRIQIDVKYVQSVCLVGEAKEPRFYQYTAIDEYSRFRILEAFEAVSYTHLVKGAKSYHSSVLPGGGQCGLHACLNIVTCLLYTSCPSAASQTEFPSG